ncbi:DUF2818 family protein [Roseateles violae]|uniref:DUF2818 family protein n=1 Tax=Roseateles violae TaxID=3058042 RepID=A0ABT8DXP5_9BURK|nr:DUF2818 family protein [Pelomonas sp. PFR6]MDN3921629.1 DUF2818 family protein [Pelomonas sp. PFR6]
MDQSAAIWLVLLAAAVAANAPYFSQRILLVGPRRRPKPVAWRLLELVLLALLTLGLGFMLEARLGQRQPQGWEFYAVSICLFITLGFPGFVWCYLRRHRND